MYICVYLYIVYHVYMCIYIDTNLVAPMSKMGEQEQSWVGEWRALRDINEGEPITWNYLGSDWLDISPVLVMYRWGGGTYCLSLSGYIMDMWEAGSVDFPNM